MNNLVLIGNIGNDIELKKTQSGTSVANLSLAVRRAFAKENQQNTDWFRVTVYGTQADNLITYCRKGSKIAVQGRVEIDQVRNSDNTTSYYTKVIANSVQYLDNRVSNQGVQQQSSNLQGNTSQNANSGSNDFFNDFNQQGNNSLSGLDITDDELPF